MKIKIMFDLKSKKVVFAEAGKDFVDFLITVMRLPLATIVQILIQNKKKIVGSLGDLYKSIDSLKSDCFEHVGIYRDVLKPSVSIVVPLLNVSEFPGYESVFYKCKTDNHNAISNLQGIKCCGKDMAKLPYCFLVSGSSGKAPGFVTGVFMVMDNLEIVPISVSLIKSKLDEFKELEEKEVKVGFTEGLAILKASMETNTVLTNVFFSKIIA